MSWNLRGKWTESCSCTVTCPCNLNQDPTLGHCDVAFCFAIAAGEVGGVDVSGLNVVWTVNLPGSFMEGDATARLYIDDRATKEQRDALEPIFRGWRGGAWEPLSGIVREWLPSREARIEIGDGEIRVGDYGRIAWEPIMDDQGRRPIVKDPPLLTFLGIREFEVAKATGTEWRDPDMKPWTSLGHAGLTTFAWEG